MDDAGMIRTRGYGIVGQMPSEREGEALELSPSRFAFNVNQLLDVLDETVAAAFSARSGPLSGGKLALNARREGRMPTVAEHLRGRGVAVETIPHAKAYTSIAEA